MENGGRKRSRQDRSDFPKRNRPTVRQEGAESRRRPTPPAGECPRQPAPTRRPPTRPTQARRQSTPCQEKEATPPSMQIIPVTTRPHIKHDRTQKTATIQPSPVIRRPPTPPSSPDSPPPKKSRIVSPPSTDNEPPTKFFYDQYKEPFFYPREVWPTTHSMYNPINW